MMSSYWINFAITGDPNGKGLPAWPSFDRNNPVVMEFGDNVKSTDLPYRKQLEFLNSVKF